MYSQTRRDSGHARFAKKRQNTGLGFREDQRSAPSLKMCGRIGDILPLIADGNLGVSFDDFQGSGIEILLHHAGFATRGLVAGAQRPGLFIAVWNRTGGHPDQLCPRRFELPDDALQILLVLLFRVSGIPVAEVERDHVPVASFDSLTSISPSSLRR